MRHAHEINPARIDDDQLASLAQPLLEPGRKDRMTISWISPEHDNDIAVLDRVEILCAADVPNVVLRP